MSLFSWRIGEDGFSFLFLPSSCENETRAMSTEQKERFFLYNVDKPVIAAATNSINRVSQTIITLSFCKGTCHFILVFVKMPKW